MPGRDGNGPVWGSGPGSGRRRGRNNPDTNKKDNTNITENVITVLTGVAVLATAVAKLLTGIKSSKQNKRG